MLPDTADRVPQNTAASANKAIEDATRRAVEQYAKRPEQISTRLDRLDAEWDVERTFELNASGLAFIGVVLAWLVSPWWLILPAVVTAFLFQHAIQGWCPPLPILRRLGFRTIREIDTERFALKALRGDFGPFPRTPAGDDTVAAHALQAARI